VTRKFGSSKVDNETAQRHRIFQKKGNHNQINVYLNPEPGGVVAISGVSEHRKFWKIIKNEVNCSAAIIAANRGVLGRGPLLSRWVDYSLSGRLVDL